MLNLEELINTIDDCFSAINFYRTSRQLKKDYCNYKIEEAETLLDGLRRVLDIDFDNAMIIVRTIHRWEQKHAWQRCFPIRECQDQIMKYLTK